MSKKVQSFGGLTDFAIDETINEAGNFSHDPRARAYSYICPRDEIEQLPIDR